MEKKLLLKNILTDLNDLPMEYIKHWYDLIHTFRNTLGKHEDKPGPSVPTDFNWDNFIDEVMENRKSANETRAKRMDSLI